MDFNATIDLIIKDLKEASDIIEDLKKYPGVPALQAELAKSKCRSAGDVISLLKNPEIAGNVFEKESAQKPAPPKVTEQKPVKRAAPAQPSAEIKEVSKTVLRDEVSEKEKTETDKPARDAAPTIADMFEPAADLYEEVTFGTKGEKDLSDRLKTGQIKSITDTIGISDKFLFIGSIFDGDKEAYAQAMASLDQAVNLDDAMAIIMKYPGAKPDSEAVIQLMELVKLKLGSDE